MDEWTTIFYLQYEQLQNNNFLLNFITNKFTATRNTIAQRHTNCSEFVFQNSFLKSEYLLEYELNSEDSTR